MMNKDPKISIIQIRALIVCTIMGIGVLSLPNQLAKAMGKDGWIPLILSGLAIIPIALIIIQIFKDNPNKDFFEIGYESLGKILFTICLILYVAYFVTVSSYISRLLGELIKGFLLGRTPIQLVSFIFIATVAYAAISEIDIIARIAYIIYPITIAFAILLFLLALPGADFTNILPMFQSDISKLPEGMWVGIFSYSGFEILLFAIPFVEEKDHNKITRASVSAILIVIVLYLIIFTITLTQFSVDQIISDPYPVLTIAKLIDLPGFFLQNLDGLIMAIWILLIFATILPLYYSSGKILSKVFKTKSHKLFILILIPITYFVGYIPENILELTSILGDIINYLGLVTILVIPTIILIVGRLRKGREKQ